MGKPQIWPLVFSKPLNFTQSEQVYYFSLLYSNLWRIAAYRRHFFEKTKQIVSDFLRFKFFKSGQISDF